MLPRKFKRSQGLDEIKLEPTTRVRSRRSGLEEEERRDEHKRSPIEVTKRQWRESD